MEEIWKEVQENPLYECSNLGNFRRKEPGKRTEPGNPIGVFLNKVTGYCSVTLAGGFPKTQAAHKVIARNFLPNPFGYKYVMFKDGNPQNIKADNLYWCHTTSINNPKAISVWVKDIRTGEVFYYSSKNEVKQKYGINTYQLNKSIWRKEPFQQNWIAFDKNPESHT